MTWYTDTCGRTAMGLLYEIDKIWIKVLICNLVSNGYGWGDT